MKSLPRLFGLALLYLLMTAAAVASETTMRKDLQLLMDFGQSDQTRWIAVNDGVMGGLSQGGPVVADGHLRFSGELSLANNGGFSSVRTANRDFDLSGVEALRLRVKGDGRRYELRLATDACFRGSAVSYRAVLATRADEWIETTTPLNTMQPSYRGTQLSGPPLEPSRVQEIGLLIADGLEGRFELLVDWIAVE